MDACLIAVRQTVPKLIALSAWYLAAKSRTSAALSPWRRISATTAGTSGNTRGSPFLLVLKVRGTAREVEVAVRELEQFTAAGAGGERHQHQQVKLAPAREPAGGQQPFALGVRQETQARVVLALGFHVEHGFDHPRGSNRWRLPYFRSAESVERMRL